MITIEQAQNELNMAVRNNPGPWEQHSLVTADNARRIAEKVPGMDPEKAYIMGLLHDIGRREGVTGMLHLIDGYDYLMTLFSTKSLIKAFCTGVQSCLPSKCSIF